MPVPAEVSLPTDRQIRVVRAFDAPRSLVYMAYVTPALVQRWLTGPPGWTMPICEIDLRVGGGYHYRWQNDAGDHSFGARGVFDEIEHEQRFVSREHFEDTAPAGEATIEVGFLDDGRGTRVIYTITADSMAGRDAALATGMTDGMEMSFKSLDRVLTDTAPGI